MSDTDSAGSRAIVVHLVHGTWPRGFAPKLSLCMRRGRRSGCLTWYENGSAFRTDLARLVGGQLSFEAFEWSGANSIGARKKAAAALKRHLADAKWRCPNSLHVIIAHSHGGNVAVEAIAEQPVAGVVALGTPFLDTQILNPTRSELWILDRALIGAIRFPLLLAMLALFWYRSTQDRASETVMLLFYALATAWVMTLFCKVFMDMVRQDLGLQSFAPESNLSDPFNFAIGRPLSFKLARSGQEAAGQPASPLVVVRAEGDEAARALAMAHKGARTWAVLWRVVPPIARLVQPLVSLIFRTPPPLRSILNLAMYGSAILLMLAFAYDPRRYLWYFVVAQLTVWWEGVLGLMMAPLLFGTSVFYALGFGWEMVYAAQLLSIRASSTPLSPICECVTMQGLKILPGHLRHSLHEFPEVRALVASWIRQVVADGT